MPVPRLLDASFRAPHLPSVCRKRNSKQTVSFSLDGGGAVPSSCVAYVSVSLLLWNPPSCSRAHYSLFGLVRVLLLVVVAAAAAVSVVLVRSRLLLNGSVGILHRTVFQRLRIRFERPPWQGRLGSCRDAPARIVSKSFDGSRKEVGSRREETDIQNNWKTRGWKTRLLLICRCFYSFCCHCHGWHEQMRTTTCSSRDEHAKRRWWWRLLIIQKEKAVSVRV